MHHLADLLDDVGVGQRRDVPCVHRVGDSDRRMILPERVFGMSGTMRTCLGRAIFTQSPARRSAKSQSSAAYFRFT